jgi:hypothetical protein
VQPRLNIRSKQLSHVRVLANSHNFRPEDSEIEVANMKPGVGQMDIFPSIWGHWAGGPGDSKEDLKWLDEKLKAFFAEK